MLAPSSPSAQPIRTLLKTSSSSSQPSQTPPPPSPSNPTVTSNASFNNIQNDVLISTENLSTLELQHSNTALRIGAGLSWSDVYHAAEEKQEFVVGGIFPSIDVRGLLLSGGLSFLSRSTGLHAKTSSPSSSFFPTAAASSPPAPPSTQISSERAQRRLFDFWTCKAFYIKEVHTPGFRLDI